MKDLFSIRAREITYRMIIIGLIVFSIAVAGISAYYTNTSLQEAKKNIYVLKNDKALVRAHSIDFNNSYDILAQSQIRELNELLFSQVPDPDNINKRTKQAEALGDKSVLTEIDKLKTNSYYDNIVNQSYFTILLTDSIQMDYSLNPHSFVYYGKLKIVRGGKLHWRDISSTGQIEPIGMITESDDKGFIIKNYKIQINNN